MFSTLKYIQNSLTIFSDIAFDIYLGSRWRELSRTNKLILLLGLFRLPNQLNCAYIECPDIKKPYIKNHLIQADSCPHYSDK